MAVMDYTKKLLATGVIIREGHVCGGCGDQIRPMTELLLVQVGHTHNIDGQVHFSTPQRAGTLTYAPYFFHPDCWEEVLDALRDCNAESMPDETSPHTVSGDCTGCGSYIHYGELIAFVQHGAVTLSDRAPGGSDALEWVMGTPNFHYLCRSCLNDINLTYLEGLWGLSEHD
jgi:hypothetical protein